MHYRLGSRMLSLQCWDILLNLLYLFIIDTPLTAILTLYGINYITLFMIAGSCHLDALICLIVLTGLNKLVLPKTTQATQKASDPQFALHLHLKATV